MFRPHAVDQNESQNPIIFTMLTPEQGYAKLSSTQRNFLIRESRTAGMISVDYLTGKKYNSCRFCFTADGWKAIAGEDIAAMLTKMIPVNVENAAKHIDQLRNEITNIILIPNGLKWDSMLMPTVNEATRQSALTLYGNRCS